jgi:hypothetical protein
LSIRCLAAGVITGPCLVDQPEEFAVLVEALYVKSPIAPVQETEHRLNQIAECGRLLRN